jgi:hypothetical protein
VAHVIEKEMLFRANAAFLRTTVVGGMAGCAIGAAVYDLGAWLGAW